VSGQENIVKEIKMDRYKNVDFDFGIPNRFDLEEAITGQLSVNDNLQVIIEDVLEGNNLCLDSDELVNTLQGVINLHQMRYNKLWEVFTALFKLDEYNNENFKKEYE
jgi:hypothetical protein